MARIGELIGPNQEVIHPKTSASVVYLEDGRSVEQVLSNDIDYGNAVFQDNTYHFGNDVEDDFAKTMIVKGQTYQNILPEPSLRNSMNNGKTMQKFNEGYDSVNVIDGVGKSAILKGQTLVNLQQKGSHWNINGSTNNPNSNASYRSNEGFPLNKIKPNTKYLVKFSKDISAAYGSFYFVQGTQAEWLMQPGGWGIVTTKSELTSSITSIHVYPRASNGATAESLQDVHPMIIEYQEGMEDWDIPYFEGMKSVESPSLVSVGKNLCDRVRGYHSNTGGTQNSWASFDMSCKPNTTYTAKIFGGSNNRFGFYSGVGVIGDTSPYTVTTGNFTQYVGGEKAFTITTGKNDNVMWVYLDNNSIASLDDVVVQVEQGIQATPYEPYKSNTLTTPSDLSLRGIGDVCDTLDLVSGEKVERIGVGVFDGSDDEVWYVEKVVGDYTTFVNYKPLPNIKGSSYTLCDKLLGGGSKGEYHSVQPFGNYINILTSKASNVSSFRNWLKQNELTICYPLETPIVKTVDLSSSGNWEKVVLDGSERWIFHDSNGEYVEFRFANTINNVHASRLGFSNKFPVSAGGRYERIAIANGATYITVKNIKAQSVEQLQSWLSQNPITVWYQTTTHKDSTQVKQPLSFSNGHVQLSSKEGSLIPSLDYEVPTSNSYHMDLMKTNTVYTMKADSASGACSLGKYDSIDLSTNKIFSITQGHEGDGLLVVHGSWINPTILEGNLTSKTIPYFKGIKSAFEGEGEIEVLSVGKNLFDNSRVNNYLAEYLDNGYVKITGGKEGDIFAEQRAKPLIKPNTKYTITVDIIENTMAGVFEVQYSGDKRASLKSSFYIDTGFVGKISKTCNSKEVIENELVLVPKVIKQNTSGHVIFRIIVEETSTPTSYEPYKSNITKIPLSSPLRSLPNGVCDEVILDRENNKVKVVQRVGDIFVNGSEKWNNMEITTPTNYVLLADNRIKCGNDRHFNNVSSSFPVQSSYDRSKENCYVAYKNQLIFTPFTERFRNLQEFKQWLSQNPTTVYYELETPIITEIDLDGYPYIYKDGHIFLNSEIAPTVGLEYSINQGHRIEGQVETLQRHEQQLTRFERYFADLVYSDYNFALYNFALLKFNETLYQEEGDA